MEMIEYTTKRLIQFANIFAWIQLKKHKLTLIIKQQDENFEICVNPYLAADFQ